MDLYLHQHTQEDPIKFSTGSSFVADKGNVDVNKTCKVEVIDLVEFISQLKQPVTVLKVDIEGAEIELMKALLDSGLINKIPHVFVETHERQIPSLVERTMLLKQAYEDAGVSHVNWNWV